jgi:Glycosyl transferase family 8.
MKTKIVYTVIGGESDIYAYQAWVSVDSLRHHQPDAHVEIVCDTVTAERISRMPLGALADKVTAIDFPAGMSARERSRRLKTNLREYVEGDYLYVDTDTIITGSLEEIDKLEGSLYAVHDAHCTIKDNPYMEMNHRNAAVLGYSLEDEVDFFNGGVVFAKDNEAAAAFYAKWNELYDLSTQRGIFIDQTSFAKANIDLGHVLQELPGIWNCQLRHGTRFLGDARIVHYLWTSKKLPTVHTSWEGVTCGTKSLPEGRYLPPSRLCMMILLWEYRV